LLLPGASRPARSFARGHPAAREDFTMLTDRLTEDMKAAMRAREAERLGVLRMTLAEIKNARIAKGEDLDDDDVTQVIKKAIKSRMESAEQYHRGSREDLAGKEEREAAILEAYLPEQLTGDALVAVVEKAIRETGASSVKDMGAVMKAVMAEHGSRVDGKTAGALVREKLGGSPRTP
jgi:hypothetical protein